MTRVRLLTNYDRRQRDADDYDRRLHRRIGQSRHACSYNAGEIVTFPDDEADVLIAAGRAVKE